MVASLPALYEKQNQDGTSTSPSAADHNVAMSFSSLLTLLPPFYEKPQSDAPNALLARIEEEFEVLVERYSYITDAFDHDVVVVNDEFVFRSPRGERERLTFVKEVEFLRLFGPRFSVNIPQYTHVSSGGDFAGYALIPRYVLSPWEFAKLGEHHRYEIVHQLTTFVNTFHRIDTDEFAPFQPRPASDFLEDQRRVKEELVQQLFPKLERQEVETIERFYGYLAELDAPPNSCPTHGDLYAFNVIWDEHESKVGVIDFSDLLIGDPANDFEVFYDYGPEYADVAYSLYDGPKDDEFLKRAKAYYQLHAIYTLLSSQLGALIAFKHARMRFRQKFSLPPL